MCDMFERMLTGLKLDPVFFKSFLCTGVISAFFKFDGKTDDATQLLRLRKEKFANTWLLFLKILVATSESLFFL